MNNYIVETNQLSKDFSGEVAVNQLSIHIRKNEILDVEKIKNEINAVKLIDVNNFAKTGYLTENITVLGNIENSSKE